MLTQILSLMMQNGGLFMSSTIKPAVRLVKLVCRLIKASQAATAGLRLLIKLVKPFCRRILTLPSLSSLQGQMPPELSGLMTSCSTAEQVGLDRTGILRLVYLPAGSIGYPLPAVMTG